MVTRLRRPTYEHMVEYAFAHINTKTVYKSTICRYLDHHFHHYLTQYWKTYANKALQRMEQARKIKAVGPSLYQWDSAFPPKPIKAKYKTRVDSHLLTAPETVSSSVNAKALSVDESDLIAQSEAAIEELNSDTPQVSVDQIAEAQEQVVNLETDLERTRLLIYEKKRETNNVTETLRFLAQEASSLQFELDNSTMNSLIAELRTQVGELYEEIEAINDAIPSKVDTIDELVSEIEDLEADQTEKVEEFEYFTDTLRREHNGKIAKQESQLEKVQIKEHAEHQIILKRLADQCMEKKQSREALGKELKCRTERLNNIKIIVGDMNIILKEF